MALGLDRGVAPAWGRLALAALDLAWAAPALRLALIMLGGEGARAALAAVALYAVGALATLIATRLPTTRTRQLVTPAFASAAVAVAFWAVAHAARPFLDAAWVGEALVGIAEARLGLWTDLTLLVAGTLLVWRGNWLVRVSPTHASAGASFQTGMIVVALGAIGPSIESYSRAFGGGEAQAGFSLVWAFGVLGTGLLALAGTRETGAGRGAGARLWGLLFTGLLLLAVFVLVSYGGAIASTVLDLATRLANAVASAVATVFAWLAALFPPDPATLPVAAAPVGGGEREGTYVTFFTVPESIRRLGGAVVMLGLFVPLLIGLVRYLAEVWRRLWDPLFMAGVSVERGDWRDGDPWRWPRALLYRFGRLLWRGAGGQALDGDPRAWPVRLAYRDLLKTAAKRGATRRPGQTPAEHLNQMAAAFPGREAELRSISEAYERARYGPTPDREYPSDLRALIRQVTRKQR
ncbi:MAG: DUF4129 domain-containing protein [Chloroflexota bacterium]